jgi:signal transduction histidine kinase
MTAWLALRVSRAALTPLRNTADAIATIDEKQLNRRIEMRDMPIELIPMCERMNQLLTRLERAFSQRKQFLADVAHELRTPTAAMLTTLELAVRRPRDHSALVESIQTSLADAKLLRRLIDTLMEQVRSDHLMDRGVIETIDVTALVRECVRAIEGLAAEKDVKVISDVPDECTITTQPDRLRSVLLNLLSNAVEYNRTGGTVRIALTRNNGGVELVVQDTGVGIPAEHLPHVFEPFYRADRAARNEQSHLGLGLFLVRSHVEAMGGNVTIESRTGEGTTLKVRLPIAAESSREPTEVASTN